MLIYFSSPKISLKIMELSMAAAFSFRILALIVLMVLCTGLAHTVFIAKTIEIRLAIEDGEMQQAVITNVKFDGEDVDISKKNFMHRRVTKVFNVPPGQYEIEWTTKKVRNRGVVKKLVKSTAEALLSN